MNQVYCISGLGADERIFSNLDVPDMRLVYLRWLIPEKNESIEAYAIRMKDQVRAEDPVFLGVSFGGIMAIELAKLYPAATVVLISSVKSRRELPSWMKWVGALGLYRLVPSRPKRWIRVIGSDFLGAETREEIRLSNEYRQKSILSICIGPSDRSCVGKTGGGPGCSIIFMEAQTRHSH